MLRTKFISKTFYGYEFFIMPKWTGSLYREPSTQGRDLLEKQRCNTDTLTIKNVALPKKNWKNFMELNIEHNENQRVIAIFL